ncbi:hypothetical protein, partial [uncultured Thiodictyon sp.]|uniref:hypothetical protein n=1 Tax=uncultured Thiodictyon sp. TaxID=1846217 RepID=UPI0025FB9E8F
NQTGPDQFLVSPGGQFLVSLDSCGQPFRPRPQNPTQTYCSQPACQRARKRDWQRAKRASDPDYRANDQAAQRTWAQAHPRVFAPGGRVTPTTWHATAGRRGRATPGAGRQG